MSQETDKNYRTGNIDRSSRIGWRANVYRLIADELSDITRYYDGVIQWMPPASDDGTLLESIECAQKQICRKLAGLPNLTKDEKSRFGILINGVFNHDGDIEETLRLIKASLSRSSRILLVLYNPYFSPLYRLATRLGLRSGPLPTTFITRTDLRNLARLTGYNIVRMRTVGYLPWRLIGIGDFLNRVVKCVPVIRWLSFTYIVVLQPIQRVVDKYPSLSCVVPARNEEGNIARLIERFPKLPGETQVIFVEGGSDDGTWDEIRRIANTQRPHLSIEAHRQQGTGKADAVRLGFEHARGDLLTILDADMTVPPELLERFYRAYCDGHADFINGSRLVYPMETRAMRFLNRLGNVFFAKALSWVLDAKVGDSLCGTKLFPRHDLVRMKAWRERFGYTDPFGDFELLFPAAVMGLGIIDVPIRYRARQYGSTNIQRFRDGMVLLKMTLLGLVSIKAGPAKYDADTAKT